MARKSRFKDANKAPVSMAQGSKPLSRAVISKLGKISDTEVARLFSLDVRTVRQERQRLKIPSFNRINWTPDKVKLLGTISDKNVAKKLGVVATMFFRNESGWGFRHSELHSWKHVTSGTQEKSKSWERCRTPDLLRSSA